MATGLLIRDFFKEYRDLRYSNSGSIGFSEIEKNAYRLALTLEVTHIDAPQYINVKTLPPNSHFGYVTLFRGSTVVDSISIKFSKFRVFDIVNHGIWAYHELTESKQLQSSEVAESVAYGTDVVGLVFDWVLDSVTNAWEFAFGGNEGGSGQSYRAYPVASPFPDVAKFRADIPCSFLWRLEAWYLVNPIIYITDNPTDTGDETEGEDEYPMPEPGDGNGDGEEFPDSDPIEPGRDPRDFPPPPPPTPPNEDFGDTLPCSSYLWELDYGWTSASGVVEKRSASGAILGRVSGIFLTGPTGGEFAVNAQSDPAEAVGSLGPCGSVEVRVLANPGVVSTRHSFVVDRFEIVPFVA